ncbi:hypothetical protein [Shewanella colwelliana]|uniref:hypothetical protein n=1 Tax=Shewanella colwelliana TaxID=23 RepID=UPI003735BDB2
MKSKRVSVAKPRTAMNLTERLFRTQLPKGDFYAPKEYWFASLNEFIDIEEVDVLSQYVEPSIIPYCIYGLNPHIAQALNERYELKGEVRPEFPSRGFAVVDNKTTLALASFDKLAQAKAHVLTLSPNVKTFRTNALGLKVEKPDYSDLPSVDADITHQEWIDYFLDKENDYSFNAAISTSGVSAMLHKLVAYGAPQRILKEFSSVDNLSNAFAFTETSQLPAYKIGLEVAMEFEFKYSRFESCKGDRNEH